MRRFVFKHHLPRLLVIVTLCALILITTGSYRHRPQEVPSIPYPGPYVNFESELQHGFLPVQEARDFCQRRRWDLYSTRNRRRRIYDLFLINTEMDWLEIRLNELFAQVDYFIILESESTFQEGPKPLYLSDNWSRFEQYHSKIIRQTVNFTGAKIPDGDTWAHERFTRNALFNQAIMSLSDSEAPSQGDVLLVSDVDEIPRRSTLTVLRNCAFPPRVTLRSHFYYYSFQWQHRGEQWAHPQATYFDGSKTVRPETLRSEKADVDLYNAAWHCSSCLPTMRDVKNKISSFSHKFYNDPYFLDQNKLLHRIRSGQDLFGRESEVFDRIDDNSDVPKTLLNDTMRQKFAYLLDRDPPNANFRDLN